LTFASALLILACSRDGTPFPEPEHEINTEDTIFPVINIDEPVADQVYTSGQTITIRGKVTDGGLYRGQIHILNHGSNSVIKDQAYEIHGLQEYNFSLAHSISVTNTTEFTATVWFEDHGLNVTTKKVKFKVNP
jgi:hypothetical protein